VAKKPRKTATKGISFSIWQYTGVTAHKRPLYRRAMAKFNTQHHF